MYDFGLWGEFLFGFYVDNEEISYIEETAIILNAEENE